MSVKDALEMAKKNKVEIVDLKFVDFPGLWQHFSIPAAELNAELFEEGLGFDGSSIRGFQSINESDMDNIRGVIGCPVAGLTPNELFDASAVVRDFTQMFLGNKDYTNLPRKFNVTITGCKEACTHAEAQDIAMSVVERRFKTA